MLKPLPTLRQLRYLSALAKYQHFGKAAEACLATQSTVSAGLVELETLLDQKLVERSRRRVIMTPLGQKLAEKADQILHAAQELVDLATLEGQAPLSATVRLGVIPTIAPYLLPAVIPQLRQDYPNLKLLLREDLSANLLARMAQGELDVVLMALPFEMEGIVCLELGQDPFVMTCLPDHPLASHTMIKAEDMIHAGMVMLEEGHCLRDHALAACQLGINSLGETIVATSLVTMVQMVNSGLGITLLPKLAVDRGILAGTSLVVRLLAPPAVNRVIALCWRDSSLRQEDYKKLAPYFKAQLCSSPSS